MSMQGRGAGCDEGRGGTCVQCLGAPCQGALCQGAQCLGIVSQGIVNQDTMRKTPCLVLLLALCLGVSVGVFLMGNVSVAVAASAFTAPHTGLEGGSRHTYGPDGEGKRDPRTVMSMPNDAYGNPVVPMEEETKPRRRLRTGASATQTPAAALPPEPQNDAGWKF